MPDINGTTDSKLADNGAGKPTVIEYITQSGVQIHITPLSLFTIQAITNRSEVEFPYPVEKDYRLTEMMIDGELVQAEGRIASGFFPASENPEYVALCKEADNARLGWQSDAIIELACQFPQWESRPAMLAHFRPRLEEIKPYVEMHKDEWLNVLEHCVFTGTLDLVTEEGRRIRTPERTRVIQLARQNANVALTMPEVVGGLRVFRLSVPGQPAH